MTKRYLNQNDKYVNDLINSIESDFIFSSKPINRFKTENIEGKIFKKNKIDQIADLKKKINSIENCNLKENSKRLVMGEGNNDSSIMLIGEAPGFDRAENTKAYSEILRILEHAKKNNIFAGIHNGTPEYALKMIDKGFNFVTIGADQRAMSAGAKAIVEKMKGSIKKEESSTY